MRTINSHRGPSLSPIHSSSLSQPGLEKLYTDENIAGNTEKALITQKGGVMMEGTRRKR